MKNGAKVLILCAVVFVVLGFASFYAYVTAPVKHATIDVVIEPGTSLNQIINRLHDNGVIDFKYVFKAYVYLNGVHQKLRAGDYSFEGGLSPSAVLKKLLIGDFRTYRIQLIEGWTYKDMAKYLAGQPFAAGVDLELEFVRLCEDRAFISSLGLLEQQTLEGYLFPDTYNIYRPKEIADLIKILVGEYRNKFTIEFQKRAGDLGLSPIQVLTLASIIEKETGKKEERNIISSVFHNRLKRGIALQSDPTVIYGIKDFDGNLKKSDLFRNHPFNTYIRPGLPPAPICNPGLESIKAALWPADTKYLYFVSMNDGSHYFSETLSEHNNAVIKYQKNHSVPGTR